MQTQKVSFLTTLTRWGVIFLLTPLLMSNIISSPLYHRARYSFHNLCDIQISLHNHKNLPRVSLVGNVLPHLLPSIPWLSPALPSALICLLDGRRKRASICQPGAARRAAVPDSQVSSGATGAAAGPASQFESISLGHRRTPEPLHGPFPPSIWLLLIKQRWRERASASQVCARYGRAGSRGELCRVYLKACVQSVFYCACVYLSWSLHLDRVTFWIERCCDVYAKEIFVMFCFCVPCVQSVGRLL